MRACDPEGGRQTCGRTGLNLGSKDQDNDNPAKAHETPTSSRRERFSPLPRYQNILINHPFPSATSTARQLLPLFSTLSFTMADRNTLVRPPPLDPSKSTIENVLELTELRVIGPVGLPYQSSRMLKLKIPGHFHQHPPPLASPRGSRNIRRRCDSAMPLRCTKNSPFKFHRPQHALLFRSRWRLRNTSHVLRGARPGRAFICYAHRAGAPTWEMYIHNDHVVCKGKQRRQETSRARCAIAREYKGAD